MNIENTTCYRTSVERYLLNRMTAGEETAFQQHLCTCHTCRDRLNAIRNLSMIVGEEWPAIRKKKLAPTISMSTNMRWALVAACLLPVFGIFLHKTLHRQGIPHETRIMIQNRADVEYVDTYWELISPAVPVSTVDPVAEEIVFRWNRESAYRLLLEADGRTIADIDSTGTAYTIDPALASRYEQLDWTLTIAGKEQKGRLFIRTK